MSELNVPAHVALIMDGNGRWAELRGRPRTFGHIKGARVAIDMIEACSNLGVKQLTLYAFSTENWLRPTFEVALLHKLLGRHLKRERNKLLKNNIRFSTIGDISRLPEAARAEVYKTIEFTRSCTGMSLTFALSYGSRQELTSTVRSIAESVRAGTLEPQQISEELISKRLQTSFMSEPDLIVRTSGEMRLSNFLLWQAAYSELYFCPTLWPDFDQTSLIDAFKAYSHRVRRYGMTTEQVEKSVSMPAGAVSAK